MAGLKLRAWHEVNLFVHLDGFILPGNFMAKIFVFFFKGRSTFV